MDILRSNDQALQQQIVALLIESLNYYRSVSSFPEITEHKPIFSRIVECREKDIDRIRNQIEKNGELASDGNHDKSTLQEFGARLEMSVSGEPGKTILERSQLYEKQLQEQVEEFLVSLECDDTRVIVREIIEGSTRLQKTLQKFRS